MESDIKPDASTSLMQMLEFGLQKHLSRYVPPFFPLSHSITQCVHTAYQQRSNFYVVLP